MSSRFSYLIRSFLLLFLFTCAGIFLHELSHHLFGTSSMLGLSRNYPLVPVSDDNMNKALVGNLAGPAANLLLGYMGILIYKIFTENKLLNNIGLFLGISNCFIALSSAVINLMVDSISGNMGNDLELASSILGINILILPAVFSLLSLIPFKTFWRDSGRVAPSKLSFSVLVFTAWLAGGMFLMLLDSMFMIRLQIV